MNLDQRIRRHCQQVCPSVGVPPTAVITLPQRQIPALRISPGPELLTVGPYEGLPTVLDRRGEGRVTDPCSEYSQGYGSGAGALCCPCAEPKERGTYHHCRITSALVWVCASAKGFALRRLLSARRMGCRGSQAPHPVVDVRSGLGRSPTPVSGPLGEGSALSAFRPRLCSSQRWPLPSQRRRQPCGRLKSGGAPTCPSRDLEASQRRACRVASGMANDPSAPCPG